MIKYEAVIGLEVHLHLKTKTKAFCGCLTEFGNEPNSQVCPVCLGFPGTLPVYNKTALRYAIKAALAIGCKVQEQTKFDRKNYYYPDLPKNYQISQYDLPLSRDGYLEIRTASGSKRIGITRLHMEEDAGKLIHKDEVSLVDYNRAGVPLLEIVSEPDISSPEEAYEYLNTLKLNLQYLDISDCDMEKGSLRCDANISLRPQGEKEFGVKIELKNMNSFKAVKDGLAFEIARQTNLLDSGEKLIQETRLWNELTGETVLMRTKEEAQDYRYFPEPDLPIFQISKNETEEIAKELPELPAKKIVRLQKDYAMSDTEARIIASSRKGAEFAEACLGAAAKEENKSVLNWLIGPLNFEANSRNRNLWELGVSPAGLIELIGYVSRQEISNLTAKSVLTAMIDSAKPAAEIIKEQNLLQISDTSALDAVIEEVIKDNPGPVADVRSGKGNAVMFLVGQAMKRSQGKANPKILQDLFKRRLNNA